VNVTSFAIRISDAVVYVPHAVHVPATSNSVPDVVYWKYLLAATDLGGVNPGSLVNATAGADTAGVVRFVTVNVVVPSGFVNLMLNAVKPDIS
jgi:hypothetical protein